MSNVRYCPVCMSQMNQGNVCKACGFDYTMDYNYYMTIGEASAKSIPVAEFRRTYIEKLVKAELTAQRSTMLSELKKELRKELEQELRSELEKEFHAELKKETSAKQTIVQVSPRLLEQTKQETELEFYEQLCLIVTMPELKDKLIPALSGDVNAQMEIGYEMDGVGKNGTSHVKARGIPWYRMAAEQGNAEAMWRLGWLYDWCVDTPDHQIIAHKWNKKSADSGNVWGIYYTGIDYRDGRGTERNLNKAKRYLKMAADNGVTEAIEDLKSFPKQ